MLKLQCKILFLQEVTPSMLYTVIIFIAADMIDSGHKMEAAVSSKMMIPICQTTRCHIS